MPPGTRAGRLPVWTVRHPGLDNHGMGTVFEELVRRFNEENNEGSNPSVRQGVATLEESS